MSNKQKLPRRHSKEPIALGSKAAEDPSSFNGFEEPSEIARAGSTDSSDVPGRSSRLTETAAYLRNPAHWWVIGLIALLSMGTFGAGIKYLEDAAQRQKSERAASPNNSTGQSQSWLNAVNPFVEPPLPTPTPQLSKEYIYAGSRMLAVEDANASAAPPADLAVWRPGNGYWYVLGGVQGSQQTFAQFGATGDIPTAGDYDGDGKTDFSVFRAGAGTFYIQRSSDQNFSGVTLGTTNDQPAPADFDGDGKTDAAVFRSSTGYWYIQQSSNGYVALLYGAGTDKPAAADFDGDGKADLAVWRASNQTFYYQKSSDGSYTGIQVGTGSGGTAAPADYDGDGTADAAFVDGSGNWTIKYSSTGQTTTIAWTAGEVVQNDYDGDGKVDIASWVASTGYWYIRQSSLGGQLRQVQWGGTINGVADIPVPAFYRR